MSTDVKQPVYLNPTMRKEYKSLIERRQKTILAALEGELTSNQEALEARIRQDRGLTLSSDELTDLIEELEVENKELMRQNSDLQNQINNYRRGGSL